MYVKYSDVSLAYLYNNNILTEYDLPNKKIYRFKRINLHCTSKLLSLKTNYVHKIGKRATQISVSNCKCICCLFVIQVNRQRKQ